MIPGTIEYKLKMADDGGFKVVQVPECPVRIMIIYQLIYKLINFKEQIEYSTALRFLSFFILWRINL